MAQPADTQASTECRLALTLLEAHEVALRAARSPSGSPDGRAPVLPDAQLQALRRHAAQACLGRGAVPPLPTHRLTQPPVAVPPVAVAPPPAWPPALPGARVSEPPAVLPRPSLRQIEPPPVLVGCDPLGCWSSDGTRLVRAGTQWLGPRGLCSVQGTLLQCP